jgi:hypothetical protein
MVEEGFAGPSSLMFPNGRDFEALASWQGFEVAMLGLSARDRITHDRIEELFGTPLRADLEAQYVKQLYLKYDILGLFSLVLANIYCPYAPWTCILPKCPQNEPVLYYNE